jgi:hypothetical protein
MNTIRGLLLEARQARGTNMVLGALPRFRHSKVVETGLHRIIVVGVPRASAGDDAYLGAVVEHVRGATPPRYFTLEPASAPPTTTIVERLGSRIAVVNGPPITGVIEDDATAFVERIVDLVGARRRGARGTEPEARVTARDVTVGPWGSLFLDARDLRGFALVRDGRSGLGHEPEVRGGFAIWQAEVAAAAAWRVNDARWLFGDGDRARAFLQAVVEPVATPLDIAPVGDSWRAFGGTVELPTSSDTVTAIAIVVQIGRVVTRLRASVPIGRPLGVDFVETLARRSVDRARDSKLVE